MAPHHFVENNYLKHLREKLNAFLQGYCTAFDNVGEFCTVLGSALKFLNKQQKLYDLLQCFYKHPQPH